MSVNSGAGTVILGGGITGLSTAYFLALAQDNSASSGLNKASPPIFVVDPSATLCAGASGQNEGALGDFGYQNEVKPLALFSYALHQQLAAENHGGEKYGYTNLNIHAVFTNNYDQPHRKLPFSLQEPEALSELPEWLKVSPSWQAGLIANAPHAMRLDPPRFCKFLYDECESFGVQFLFKSRVVSVKANLSCSRLDHVEISTWESPDTVKVPCGNIVVAAGSWSDRLFSSLFPNARVRIPLVEEQPSQSWLRIQGLKRNSKMDIRRCDQVWLNEVITDMSELHISTFREGDMYIAGDFAAPEDLPQLPEDVEAHHDDLEKLLGTAKRFLENSNDKELRPLNSGRAYLPQTITGIPIIAKLDWTDVFPSNPRVKISKSSQQPMGTTTTPEGMKGRQGGIFVNVGQYLNGFVLGPGSGKVMSEMILGHPTSVDTLPFQMPKQGLQISARIREDLL